MSSCPSGDDVNYNVSSSRPLTIMIVMGCEHNGLCNDSGCQVFNRARVRHIKLLKERDRNRKKKKYRLIDR